MKMKWSGHHDNPDPFRFAPEWARVLAELQEITIIQNEMILAKLEERSHKLSPEDQAAVDEIWKIEKSDQKKVEDALNK